MNSILKIEKNENDLKHEALRICQDYLGSTWNTIQVSDFKISRMSEGFSNALYHCSLLDDIKVENPKTPRQVLLRFYGLIQEEEHVIVTEATTFMLLAERKLGPKLYGVFPKGRLEEYIPSRTLRTDDIRRMSTTIAREMAKIHALEVPVRKEPDLFPKYSKKWFQDVERERIQNHNANFHLLDFYREEIEWVTAEMKQSKSPIVYCHNDLTGGNILLRDDSPSEDEPNLVLIDFEFGSYNYRGFDIANQFCEWVFDYNTPEMPHFTTNIKNYPRKEQQIQYITAYLEQLVSEGCMDPSVVPTETEKILKEVKLFGMIPHLLYSLWSEKMKPVSSCDFCYETYANKRRDLYRMLKEKYLKKKTLCNGKE